MVSTGRSAADTGAEPVTVSAGRELSRRSTLRDGYKAQTRDALVSAAVAAFQEHGYVDVAVEDIARAAGTSRATFYAHFSGKAAVLHAVVERLSLQEGYQELLQSFTEIGQPTVPALEAWLDRYVDFYVEHKGLHRAIYQARAVEPEFAQAKLLEIRQYIRLWTSLGFVDDAASEDLRLGAMMMYALVDETLYLWLVDGFEADRTKVVRALAEAFERTFNIGASSAAGKRRSSAT